MTVDSTRDAPPFYERGGLDVALYDAAVRGRVGDVARYVALAREWGGPVVELGCGTGRVSRAIAAAGIDVVGVDRSAAMLALAPRELRVVRGDLRRCALALEARVVIAPFRVLQCLTRESDWRAAFREARRLLAPGGLLAFDVWTPTFPLPAYRPSDGATLERRATDGRVVEETWRFRAGGAEQRRTLRFLVPDAADVARWLSREGFHDARFERGFVDPDDDLWLARVP